MIIGDAGLKYKILKINAEKGILSAVNVDKVTYLYVAFIFLIYIQSKKKGKAVKI